MTVTAWGAILGLIVAVVLILKKVQPTYAMIAGAIVGGLVGGAGLGGTVNYMIEGTKELYRRLCVLLRQVFLLEL